MKHWVRARYQVNLPLYEGREKVTACGEHIDLARRAAREGMVLLKNENGTLPLRGGCRLALFGKGTFDYVKGGGGSGDVTCAWVQNLYDGLKELPTPPEIFEPLCDFYRADVAEQMAAGAQPGLMREPELPGSLLSQAREFTDTAVISISRFSGEGWDRKSVPYPGEEADELAFTELSQNLFPGSDFYLTPAESAMVEAVCGKFTKVIAVLNTGGLMDVKWIAGDERIGAGLLAWQGGMTGGAAAAELLFGLASPCGKLPDTMAENLSDYPFTDSFHKSPDYVEYKEDIYVGYRYFETIPGMREKVVYPFGYGLSYTTFSIETIHAEERNGQISFDLKVTNTGAFQGREVVHLYYSAPEGMLGKPAKSLAAYRKTALLAPGETETITLEVHADDMASYDDLGKIARSAYVLEAGDYRFFVGNNVRDAEIQNYVYHIDSDRVVRQLSGRVAPCQLSERLRSDGSFEALPLKAPHDLRENGLGWDDFPGGKCLTPQIRFVDRMPFFGSECEIPFEDVAEGKRTLSEFMAKLSLDEKIHILGGQPNTGVANTFGFGGLPEYDVPSVMTADGPAGLRIRPECGVYTTDFPCATLLASTWDPDLVEQVGFAAGEEVKENNIFVWLTPAVNIHRSPLCGRNFEYYSEDPLLAGTLSGAMIRGIQRNGVAAAIKHFCCNNKETNRRYSDSRVSERALREIYLKAFEIAWKTGHFWTLMTSYNIVNSQRCSESEELLQGILREEWGFDGLVMTDWWNSGEQYKEINAGNDVKMGCGFPERVKRAYEMGLVSEEKITVSAERVLSLLLKLA